MRCLTLAHELVRRGAIPFFVVQPPTLETVPALARAGWPVETVSSEPQQWIDAVQHHAPSGVDLLVIDSYAIGEAEEIQLRKVARRILVIDDLADRRHDCDVLLDQNLGRRPEDYKRLAPQHCEILVGPHYALLRPEFAAARERALARRRESSDVRRILVSLGLTDMGGITKPVVEAVLSAKTGASIDVVLGQGAESLPALLDLSIACPEVSIHVDIDDIHELMVQADIAIGSGGSTSWERCCLGLPTVILVLAENQRAIALALEKVGASVRCRNTETITDAVRLLACNRDQRRQTAERAAGLVDGIGAERACDILIGVTMDKCPGERAIRCSHSQ